jgi:zinc protease
MRILIAIIILCFLSSPVFAAGKVLNIQEVTSKGGIKAWLVEDHSVPVIAMEFGFKGAGSVLDPADKQGLSRMLSNTMDEGAGHLNSQSFQKELRDLSISLGFGSTRDDFTGSLKTLTRNKERAFELLTLALTDPRFDKEAVDRMRAANLSRIRASLGDPEWIAARLLNDTAFSGHAYAQNSGGTLSSLGKIGPAELKDFHHKYLGRNNVVVSVAGDMTKEELAAALDNIFGAMPAAAIPAPPQQTSVQNAGKITIFKQDIPQTIIEMIQPGINRKDPDYQIAQIMNFILGSSGFGSRLTEEIREKRGLTYGIYSYFTGMRYFDGLQVSTSTENKNAADVLALTKIEWEKMKSAPVSETEMKDAKAYLIGSLPLGLTSTDDIAGLMLSLQIDDMPVDYLEQREAAIKKATPADVQRVAQRILDADKMTVVLVGAPEGIENGIIVEKLPNAK